MRKSSNPNFSKKKKESLYLKCLNEQLINLKTNTINTSEICFSDVRLSLDNSYLNVFVDSRQRSKVQEYVDFLNKNAGIFRTYLAKQISTYKVPTIRFYLDPVIDNVIKINNIFNEINKKDEK